MLGVFGDWNESYQALLKWMNILKLTNPGANIVWKTIHLGGIFGNVRFMRVFWTFRPNVEEFKHCRPIIKINVVCAHMRIDSWQFVEKYYRMDAYPNNYTLEFNPIPHESYWSYLDFPILHPDPTLMRNKGCSRFERTKH
ncbi:hypothetical protein AAG906_026478 [Vitis piasezkii]